MWDAILFTLVQSILSTFMSLFVGLIIVFGLLANKGIKPISAWWFLLPSFLPPLFVVLAVFKFTSWVGSFPFGLYGILLIHVLINIGLVSVALYKSISEKYSGQLELAYLEGAKPLIAFVQILRSSAWQIVFVAFTVFSFCMVSFAVPLLAGKGSTNVLEVFIYEKLRVDNDLAGALWLCLLQFSLVFAFSLVFKKDIPWKIKSRPYEINFFNLKVLGWLVNIPSLIILIGLGAGLFPLLAVWNQLDNPELTSAALSSLSLGLFVMLLTYILSLVVSLCIEKTWRQKWLVGITVPSVSILGVILFSVSAKSPESEWMWTGIGLSFLFFPVIYKLFLHGRLENLMGQWRVARLMGASGWKNFRYILWPQLHKIVLQGSMLAAVWALGDFALSSMVSTSSFSLGLVIRDYLGSYRLDEALHLSWILIFLSGLIYIIGGMFNDVFD